MKLIASVAEWAAERPDVRAVTLAGSHARGEARPGSDVDLVIVVDDPEFFLNDTSWLGRFGSVQRCSIEEYGIVLPYECFSTADLKLSLDLLDGNGHRFLLIKTYALWPEMRLTA